jgi:hypothetical protein
MLTKIRIDSGGHNGVSNPVTPFSNPVMDCVLIEGRDVVLMEKAKLSLYTTSYAR